MSYDDADDEYEHEYEYLAALSTVLADPSEVVRTVDGWRIERLGLIQGAAGHGTIYDPLGPEGGGPCETVPVRTQDWGDTAAGRGICRTVSGL
jgi:hypothetical protein